jgi:dCTP deaminase
MTLTKRELLDRLNRSNDPEFEPITVTPILDLSDQVGVCGIDIRLGKQFIVFKQHLAGYFTPLRESNYEGGDIGDYQEEVVVSIQKCIVLHPRQLIIGSTLEYIRVPNNLECQVEGRSSWARLGLIVAAASTIEPGYKGVITLELSNVGTIPLELFPGVKIAQLIFHSCSKPHTLLPEEEKNKKYQCAIGPGFSRIHKDKHLQYFCKAPR